MECLATESVRRILTALSRRNPGPGYSQGMDYIAFLLSAFQTEQQVFWTLCAIVESLLPSDFYAPPPSSMAGYRVEIGVLTKLAQDRFSSAFKKYGEDLENAIEQMAPKWFICICVDTMDLHATLVIFEAFFFNKGHNGVLPCVFAILKKALPLINSGEDVVISLMTTTGEVTASELRLALNNPNFEVDVHQAKAIREKKKVELCKETNKGGVGELSVWSHLPMEQLELYQTMFRSVYTKSKGGCIVAKFKKFLKERGSVILSTGDLAQRLFMLSDKSNTKSLHFAEFVTLIYILTTPAPAPVSLDTESDPTAAALSLSRESKETDDLKRTCSKSSNNPDTPRNPKLNLFFACFDLDRSGFLDGNNNNNKIFIYIISLLIL